MGGNYTAPEQNLVLDLPDGWMRWNQNTKDFLFLTRDGAALQSITIESIHASSQLKHTKKKLRNGMLPLEAAEVILDNISSNPKIHGLEVIENRSVKIDNRPGFRTVYTFKNSDGLKVKGVVYGFMQGEWLYELKYMAAQRYYFDRDLKLFEKVAGSARLLNP
jgi:hypothetical protein